MKSGAFGSIGGAFAHQLAPFAVHPLDRERAARYLQQAVMLGLNWDEAERDIRSYLTEKGCDPARIEAEVERARPLLQPWLK